MAKRSRVEAILRAVAAGKEYKREPQSRIEDLLINISDIIGPDHGGTGPTEDDDFDESDVDDIMSVISTDNGDLEDIDFEDDDD